MKFTEVKAGELPFQIARAVLVAPDISPHTQQISGYEVAVTVRPGWSKVSKYEAALPGGKISSNAGDFEGIEDTEALNDPTHIITLEKMIRAGLNAVEREVLEELDVVIATGLLSFVDVSQNEAGWTTYSYVAELQEKPPLLVKPNSAGSRWVAVDTIKNSEFPLLSGHLGITRRALKKLGR